MLIFTLKKEWFEKIKSGKKTIKYLEINPFWSKLLANEFDFNQYSFCSIGDRLEMLTYYYPVKFRQKYTKNYIEALVNKIEIVDGKNTDLHIDKPVYAIYLVAVKEV